jgi:hypothetical protein
MSSYGRQARHNWETLAPTALAQMEDPETFFRDLGEQAEAMVAQLAPKIAGPDPAGESYLEKVGRLNAAKAQAEEVVRLELLTPTEEEQDPEDDQVSETSLIPELLEVQRIKQQLREMD